MNSTPIRVIRVIAVSLLRSHPYSNNSLIMIFTISAGPNRIRAGASGLAHDVRLFDNWTRRRDRKGVSLIATHFHTSVRGGRPMRADGEDRCRGLHVHAKRVRCRRIAGPCRRYAVVMRWDAHWCGNITLARADSRPNIWRIFWLTFRAILLSCGVGWRHRGGEEAARYAVLPSPGWLGWIEVGRMLRSSSPLPRTLACRGPHRLERHL
jgi:hypothetical protein